MEIRTLTKKQLKSTLSEKKSKSKEVIKNILSTPYRNSFWPLVAAEDAHTLKIILEKNLPCLKTQKINIPWKEIKNITKLERKKFRIEYAHRMNIQFPESSKGEGLVLGINDVTRGLELDSLGTVLISDDVNPKLMVQHLIDMSVVKNIPLLVVPNLRTLTKTCCGISSVALGIERNVPETSTLSVIQNYIKQSFKNVSPPKEHVNFNRSLIVNTEATQIEEKNINTNTEEMVCEDQIENSIYLQKTEKNTRVFNPEEKEQVPTTGVPEYIKFDEITDTSKRKLLSKYIPLKVKRVKSDSSRQKKKIKILKKSN